jgi:hypothetical protein
MQSLKSILDAKKVALLLEFSHCAGPVNLAAKASSSTASGTVKHPSTRQTHKSQHPSSFRRNLVGQTPSDILHQHKPA